MALRLRMASHVRKGCLDTCIILAMTMLPTIISALAERSKSKFEIKSHFLSGEFLLYSISFLCATFLVFAERSGGRKDWKSYANAAIFIGVAIIASFYGIMLTVDKPDLGLIKTVTIAALVVSVPVFFFSQIINNSAPDIQLQRTAESQLIQDSIS